MISKSTRRQFIGRSVAGGALLIGGSGFFTSRAVAESKSANEKLNLAIIGSGGRGAANADSVAGENIVALCDVNENNLNAAAERYAGAKKFVDFRKLYDAMGNDIDAVVVSTPEHIHAVSTMPALKLGKHVYCEKPLAHSVWETRMVVEAARAAKVATQMGTQIHATDNYRRVVELVKGGAIGKVSEAHVWVSRDWGGGERPAGEDPVPAWLNWDLWLGPAPYRPFKNEYVPGPNWYKYWDFGGGVMPDLGSHWNDLPFWALDLDHPTAVEAEGPPVSTETAPPWIVARWDHPVKGDRPAVKLTWYQGGKKPELVTDGKAPAWDSGCLFVGEDGRMLIADYDKHQLLPEAEFASFTRPEPTIPNSIGHHAEWIAACKTGSPTTCHFDYSGTLTEANLLGNVAYRVGKRLEWDPTNLRATNAPEADKLIHPQFREGWSL